MIDRFFGDPAPPWVLALLMVALLMLGCGGSGSTPDAATPPHPPPAEQAVDPGSFPAVVARVNGSDISQSDLLARAKAASKDQPENPDSKAFYLEILNDLISSELLFQESEAKGLVPGDTEIEERLATIRGRFPSAEEFQSALTRNGLTEEKMKTALRKDLGVERLIQKEVTSLASVDESEVRRFFDENPDKMRTSDELRVSHILVKVDPNASQPALDQARKKAESLRSRVVAGEDFAKLARENSDDPGSAALGGDLSWMGKGVMVPAFEEAAYALKPGEISPVTKTQFGFHVLKLVDKRPGEPLEFEQVKDQIARYLKELSIQERIGAKVKSLRDKAVVEVFI